MLWGTPVMFSPAKGHFHISHSVSTPHHHGHHDQWESAACSACVTRLVWRWWSQSLQDWQTWIQKSQSQSESGRSWHKTLRWGRSQRCFWQQLRMKLENLAQPAFEANTVKMSRLKTLQAKWELTVWGAAEQKNHANAFRERKCTPVHVKQKKRRGFF